MGIIYRLIDGLLGIDKCISRTGKKLQIDLVPIGMHRKNVRAVLTPAQWKEVCSITHKLNRNRCVDCGRNGQLECHERWKYSYTNLEPSMQVEGLYSLCHECHMGKHIGFARKNGEFEQVKAHLKKVYGLSNVQLNWVIYRAFKTVSLHGVRVYQLDLRFLNHDRYRAVIRSIGRQLTANEYDNCRDMGGHE